MHSGDLLRLWEHWQLIHIFGNCTFYLTKLTVLLQLMTLATEETYLGKRNYVYSF